MKTILAIINEPKESKDFIRYVAGLAADLKVKVHLLYVQNQNNYPMGIGDTTGAAVAQVHRNMEDLAGKAKKILKEQIKDVKSRLAEDVKIDYSTQLGVTSLEAQQYVSDNKADMVVLEGRQDESFWMQNSSNMEIIKSVECPVWIVPYNWIYKTYTKIIYATDYKEEDITDLKKLIALTHHFTPDITALHITDSADFEEKVKKTGFNKMLQKKMAYDQLSLEVINEKSNKDVAELLNDYALALKADLVVVLKENRSFFERIFKSDPAKKAIKKSMLPVLIFHEKE